MIGDAINAHGLGEEEVTDAESNTTLMVADDGQLLEKTAEEANDSIEEVDAQDEISAITKGENDAPNSEQVDGENDANLDAEDVEKETE